MNTPTLEDVLTELAILEKRVDQATLNRYLDEYPQHHDAIVDFACAWVAEEAYDNEQARALLGGAR